jgi:hypothetical protein
MFQDFIDELPILGVFLAFAILSLVLYEIGFRIGRWWQDRTPEEKEGPTGMIVGSILGLMAFLLAITMSMATQRYDTRRGLVLEEANDIGTTYLRAEYLPEPASSQTLELLREYVPLRIVSPEVTGDVLDARLARSNQIQNELWAIAADLARVTPDSEMLGLYISSLNDTIDVSSERITAGIYARVPGTVLMLLFVGSALTLGMMGFSAGLTRRRSPLTAVVLIVVLGAVITLVVDIDRSQGGSVTVSQQPLLTLQQQIGPPANPGG